MSWPRDRSTTLRRLGRDRWALVALSVVAGYVLVAAAVRFGGVVTLPETSERVGPGSLPGLFRDPPLDVRVENCLTYLEPIERALASREPRAALAEIRFAELCVAERSLAALTAVVERCYERVDAIDALGEGEDLAAAPGAAAAVGELESTVRSLYRAPAGLAALTYRLRLVLGTDREGRSIAARGVYSIAVALEVGIVTAIISVLLGALLGAIAGFWGGWIDHGVVWLYSTFSSIPYLVLVFVLVFVFTGTVWENTLLPLYVAFCGTFWIGPCRVIRGEVMKLREREYVQAAVVAGLRDPAILLRHVLPNTAHLLSVNVSLLCVAAIKSEVILSFLGFGVKEGPSWGIMISQARLEIVGGFFWQIGTATALMFGLVLALNVLSDSIQDVLDPRHPS